MRKLFLFFILMIISLTGIYSLDLQDGYYNYSISNIVAYPDIAEQYAQDGLDGSVENIELFEGVVVYIENMSFIEPIKNIRINIDRSGNLTSDDSIDLHGNISNSGSINWKGTVDRRGTSTYVECVGNLTIVTDQEKADPSYNGVYYLSGDIHIMEIKVVIEDGIMRFEPINYEADDGESWSGRCIVDSNGNFRVYTQIVTKTVLRFPISDSETFESVTDITNIIYQEGRISSNGIIFNYIQNDSSATDNSNSQNRYQFAGTKTHTLNYYEGENTNQAPEFPPVDLSATPEWYINPNSGPNRIAESGSFRLQNRSDALKMAQLAASGNIAFTIQASLKSSLEDYSNINSDSINIRYFKEIIDSTSMVSFPVTIDNEYYDNNTQTAYVQVSISEEELFAAIESKIAEYERINNLSLPDEYLQSINF